MSLSNPESYAGGSFTPGSAWQAGQVKGERPDKFWSTSPLATVRRSTALGKKSSGDSSKIDGYTHHLLPCSRVISLRKARNGASKKSTGLKAMTNHRSKLPRKSRIHTNQNHYKRRKWDLCEQHGFLVPYGRSWEAGDPGTSASYFIQHYKDIFFKHVD